MRPPKAQKESRSPVASALTVIAMSQLYHELNLGSTACGLFVVGLGISG